ncbi:MAG: hypothetical protein IIT49_01610, partial [Clostridia bacterium]|nr:hypothetical protein [Clostridia bacterium]
MIYYISDLHLGHKNVIRFDSRPFANTDVMEKKIISKWNEKIKYNDTVYVLGDVFYGNKTAPQAVLEKLVGHKHLIVG